MAIINQATKELQVKVVYYGPAMGGKTTNLVKVHENIQTAQEKVANLEDNLRTLKMNLADIPYVLQYNKRDLPNVAPVEYMEFLLNNRDVQVPSFTAVASNCEGVFESLNMITRLLLHKFINESGRRPASA